MRVEMGMETRITVPRGIVFVSDPTNRDVAITAYDPEEPTASNSSCISVKAQPAVDGEVTLRMLDQVASKENDELTLVFDDIVDTPGRRLAVFTNQPEPALQMAVGAPSTKVAILVDDRELPSVIEVRIQDGS